MNADSWELYSDMDGVEGVAEVLTMTLENAKKQFTQDLATKTGPEAMRDAWGSVYKKLAEYDSYGACDTEPRAVARYELAKHAAFRTTGQYSKSVIDQWLDQIF
jgi:hypothetical protein